MSVTVSPLNFSPILSYTVSGEIHTHNTVKAPGANLEDNIRRSRFRGVPKSMTELNLKREKELSRNEETVRMCNPAGYRL